MAVGILAAAQVDAPAGRVDDFQPGNDPVCHAPVPFPCFHFDIAAVAVMRPRCVDDDLCAGGCGQSEPGIRSAGTFYATADIAATTHEDVVAGRDMIHGVLQCAPGVVAVPAVGVGAANGYVIRVAGRMSWAGPNERRGDGRTE